MLSGDDVSKEQIEKQVLNIWDKLYKTWFAKVVRSVVFFIVCTQTNGCVCSSISCTA